VNLNCVTNRAAQGTRYKLSYDAKTIQEHTRSSSDSISATPAPNRATPVVSQRGRTILSQARIYCCTYVLSNCVLRSEVVLRITHVCGTAMFILPGVVRVKVGMHLAFSAFRTCSNTFFGFCNSLLCIISRFSGGNVQACMPYCSC
jgi:hypothetical protein